MGHLVYDMHMETSSDATQADLQENRIKTKEQCSIIKGCNSQFTGILCHYINILSKMGTFVDD